MKEKILLSLVIPCLNEEGTIEEAVETAYQAGKKWVPGKFEVVVADNDSSDGSVEKVKKQGVARLIKVPVRGYGAALHWGILKAKGKFVLYTDADLSYDFQETKKFIPFIKKDFDLILGSRMKGKIDEGAMPFLNQYLGTPLLTGLIRLIYRIKTTDCNSGMRMVKKSFYQTLHMRNSGMEWASELLLKTALHKGKYAEVPINFYKDQRNRPPHLLRWADGWRHLKAIVLLKPNSLAIFLPIFLIIAVVILPKSFGVAFFFGLLTEALLLSLLALKMLQFAIEGKESRLIKLVRKLPITPIGILVTIIAFAFLFIIPDIHLGTKLLLASAAIIFDVWVFLMETIETHLINRLSESI